MRIVTAQELENWLTSGKVLEKDVRGPKVVALGNGLFLKIFYTRTPCSLACGQPATALPIMPAYRSRRRRSPRYSGSARG